MQISTILSRQQAARAVFLAVALAAAFPTLAQRPSTHQEVMPGTAITTANEDGTTANTTSAPTSAALGASAGGVNSATAGGTSGVNNGESSGIVNNVGAPNQTPQATVGSPASVSGTNAIGTNGVAPAYTQGANGNIAPPAFNGGIQSNLTSPGSSNFTPPATANTLNGTAINGGVTSTTGSFVQNRNAFNAGIPNVPVSPTSEPTTSTTGPLSNDTAVPGAAPSQGPAPTQGPSPTF